MTMGSQWIVCMDSDEVVIREKMQLDVGSEPTLRFVWQFEIIVYSVVARELVHVIENTMLTQILFLRV